jgi:NRPS condensation-like uncharacterized protein
MTMKPKAIKATRPKPSKGVGQIEKMVALTLKIDSETYQRLSALRAKERKTAQDILSEALMEYLDQAHV